MPQTHLPQNKSTTTFNPMTTSNIKQAFDYTTMPLETKRMILGGGVGGLLGAMSQRKKTTKDMAMGAALGGIGGTGLMAGYNTFLQPKPTLSGLPGLVAALRGATTWPGEITGHGVVGDAIAGGTAGAVLPNIARASWGPLKYLHNNKVDAANRFQTAATEATKTKDPITGLLPIQAKGKAGDALRSTIRNLADEANRGGHGMTPYPVMSTTKQVLGDLTASVNKPINLEGNDKLKNELMTRLTKLKDWQSINQLMNQSNLKSKGMAHVKDQISELEQALNKQTMSGKLLTRHMVNRGSLSPEQIINSIKGDNKFIDKIHRAKSLRAMDSARYAKGALGGAALNIFLNRFGGPMLDSLIVGRK